MRGGVRYAALAIFAKPITGNSIITGVLLLKSICDTAGICVLCIILPQLAAAHQS